MPFTVWNQVSTEKYALDGDDLNQMIYKSRFKSFPTTYDFDLNQFSTHDS